MTGTGPNETLSLICTPNSVEIMMHGHAYNRAVRAHVLVHSTLTRSSLEDFELEPDDLDELQRLSGQFPDNRPTIEKISEFLHIICTRKNLSSFGYQRRDVRM